VSQSSAQTDIPTAAIETSTAESHPSAPNWGLDTVAIHGGYRPDAPPHAAAVPIYQSTSFTFEDVEHAANLFDLKTPGFIYSRIGNPTVAVLEERLALLEGGIGALAFASGMAAITAAVLPALCRPIEFGADIVIHALTKYLGGHGNSLGGVIIDSGRFDFSADTARFNRLNTPEVSYHGAIYTRDFGAAAFIVRARTVALRNTGAALPALNAFLILQGIETLGLRMQRHCANTQAIARYLAGHPKVATVRYAGLPEHPQHALAQRYFGGQASGILSFALHGGREAGIRFIEALRLFYHLVNIGDARSLAAHPASTTHRQLNEQELAAAGVTPALVRLSIGLENEEDLIADLDQALAQV